ncbi:MAG TPA: alcohol dehydrogenase catalytic domain-containing protein [Acidimicrobiales bacterium]|nr:alcohol dehydrogenase catalytic domain-containing protein [Acidimicrobiales bacterium]
MADTVHAAVLVEPRTIEVEEFPVPEVGEADAVIRVEGTGICGSDWAPYAGSFPVPLPPVILGHEVVGRIQAIGDEAARVWGLAEGDRVVVEEAIPCGRCTLCRRGLYALCDGLHGTAGRRYGMIPAADAPHLWGGYGDLMYIHPNSVVHRIDASLPVEIAPLYIPVSNGVAWVQGQGAGIGSTVLVQGPGQHGLGCVVGAREAGAAEIIVAGTGRDAARLEVARRLGATHTVDVDDGDLVEQVRELTDGRMCDLVVDVTSAAPAAAEVALDLAAVAGTIVLAGFKEMRPLTSFLSDKIIMKALTVKGAWGHDQAAVRAAIGIIESRRHPLEEMCTHTFPLDQVDAALETLGGERGDPGIHITIVPGS